MAGEPPGKKPRANRPTERRGVRAAAAVFDDANHYFHEVDLQDDIGKDAYVDLRHAGVFTGDMVALQIKSGAKYRRGDNYMIDCTEHDVAVWRGSPVPVVGVVYDLDARTLHWTDLTAWAKAQAAQNPPKYCPVDRASVLSAETLDDFVAIMRGRLREFTDPMIFDLASEDPVAQTRAVYDCWAVGMRDPRPLLLLRSSVRWLAEGDPARLAIMFLSLATPHPDVFWTAKNRLPDPTRDRLRRTYRWSIEEAEKLLGAVDLETWERGGLGQCVYMLLMQDPTMEAVLRAVVAQTANEDVAYAATLTLLNLRDDGVEMLAELASTSSALQRHPLLGELHVTLVDHDGFVDIF